MLKLTVIYIFAALFLQCQENLREFTKYLYKNRRKLLLLVIASAGAMPPPHV